MKKWIFASLTFLPRVSAAPSIKESLLKKAIMVAALSATT
jgi:hypothetical protein